MKFYRSLYYIVIALFGATIQVFAQASDGEKKKIFLRLNNESDVVYPQVAKNNNFVFLYPTKRFNDKLRDWEIVLVDTNLSITNRNPFSCAFSEKSTVITIESFNTNDISYFLITPKYWLSSSENWLVTYDFQTGKASSKLIDVKQFSIVTKVIRVGNSLLIAGHDKKTQPKFGIYDMATNQLKLVPIAGTFEGATVSALAYRTISKEALLVLTVYKDDNSFENRFVVIDSLNQVTVNRSLSGGAYRKRLIGNIKVVCNDSNVTIIGTYSYFKFDVEKDIILNPKHGHPLSGFFLSQFNHGYEVKYTVLNPAYEMGSIVNLRAIKEMSEDNESPNEGDKTWNFRLHDIYKKDSTYIMHGEVFRPKYFGVGISVGYVPTGSVPVFSGYGYAGFATIGMGASGNRLWDIADNFDFDLSLNPEVHSSIIHQGNKWRVIYMRDKRLIEKEVQDNSKYASYLSALGSKIANYKTYTQRIMNWYGNRIILFGYEGKKSDDLEDLKKLFFMEKR